MFIQTLFILDFFLSIDPNLNVLKIIVWNSWNL